MKKMIVALALFFVCTAFAATVQAVASPELVAIGVDQEDRQKITVEDLPDPVVEAWNGSDYAQNTVKEIHKVTTGNSVTYEITYVDASGNEKMVIYDAEGNEVG